MYPAVLYPVSSVYFQVPYPIFAVLSEGLQIDSWKSDWPHQTQTRKSITFFRVVSFHDGTWERIAFFRDQLVRIWF